MAEQAFNIPQIIAVLLVGFLVVRWFFSSSNTPATSSRNGGRQVNPAHVEQVLQMFPQLDRRTVMWDLQRNGGSVQATTERVLAGRGLAQPPPSFRPQLPASPTPATTSTSRAAGSKSMQPDLITRYNLSSKVSTGEESEQSHTTSGAKQSGWSQNKLERSELMRRRKEEMVLAARRKMEAQDKSAAGTS